MRILSVGRVAAGLVTLASATAAFAAGSSPTPTPTALGTSGYTQDFDSLASNATDPHTLPEGWQIVERGSGAAADGDYAVGNGSDNTGGAYSFGATGSTDRALGSLTSNTANPITLGAFFENMTGETITTLAIDYFGELWRRGGATGDTLSFAYYVGTPSALNSATGWTTFTDLDFASPGGTSGRKDGNAVTTEISASISDLSIATNEIFAIRWTDMQVGSANDGLAIDNLVIRANPTSAVPEAGTWAMMVVGFGTLGAMLRRRRPVRAFA